MSSFGGTIHHDELLWLLGSLSGLYRLPFDAALVAQSFPPPYDHAVLLEAARSLGFKTGTRATVGFDWQKLPLPAVGFLLSTPETNPQPAPDSPSIDHPLPKQPIPRPTPCSSSSRSRGSSSSILASAHGPRKPSPSPGQPRGSASSSYRSARNPLPLAMRSSPASRWRKRLLAFPGLSPSYSSTKKIWRDIPVRFVSHSVGRPHQPAFHPGDYRQGHCQPEQKHPDRPRPGSYHAHALQCRHDLAQAVPGATHRQSHRRRVERRRSAAMNLNVQLKLGGFLSWPGGHYRGGFSWKCH